MDWAFLIPADRESTEISTGMRFFSGVNCRLEGLSGLWSSLEGSGTTSLETLFSVVLLEGKAILKMYLNKLYIILLGLSLYLVCYQVKFALAWDVLPASGSS